MKMRMSASVATLGLVLGLGSSLPARADVSSRPVREHTFDGMAVVVDQPDKMISVHHFWGTRRFNLADDCLVSMQDKAVASLADLRPGQKLEVDYQKIQGVLVAHRIVQRDLVFTGHVMSLDKANHEITLRHRALDKTFHIAEGCRVVLRDQKDGTLADVQPGHRITVIFEEPGGKPTARQIAQTSETFAGTLTAVDLDNRTVKAKALLGEKTFNLAGDCSIVLGAKPGAKLRDLRLGDKFVFSYDDIAGVEIVNRIAPSGATSEPLALSARSTDATASSPAAK